MQLSCDYVIIIDYRVMCSRNGVKPHMALTATYAISTRETRFPWHKGDFTLARTDHHANGNKAYRNRLTAELGRC